MPFGEAGIMRFKVFLYEVLRYRLEIDPSGKVELV